MLVQVSEDDTDVYRNGVKLTATALKRGDTLRVAAVGRGDLFTGRKGTEAAPVAAYLTTSGKGSVDGWFFTLTPPDLLNHEYVVPLGPMRASDGSETRTGLVRLYVYAYDDGTGSPVAFDVYQGTTKLNATAINLAAGTATTVCVGTGTGCLGSDVPFTENAVLAGAIRVTATEGRKLQVLSAVNSGDSAWDWGFPVVGSRHLLNEYFVPWSPAHGPNWPNDPPGPSSSFSYLNGGYGQPLFVSPVQDGTVIRVDWDPGADDGNEVEVTLDAGQWIALVDTSDGDNRGARITGSIDDTQGLGAAADVPEGAFALAWGEDLLAHQSDGYDLGYAVLPQKASFFKPPILEIEKTVVPEVTAAGGVFTVTLAVTARKAVEDVSISDILPSTAFSYVPLSTTIALPDGTTLTGPSAEPSPNPPDPATEIHWPLQYDFVFAGSPPPEQQAIVVTFKLKVAADYPFPAGQMTDSQDNLARATGRWCVTTGICFDFEPEDRDDMTIVAAAVSIVKSTNGDDANDAPGPAIPVGSPVSWTYDVENVGLVTLVDLVVTDDQNVVVSCPSTTLEPERTMTCTASGTAVKGPYRNVGSVVGFPSIGGQTLTVPVTAQDPSHYFGTQAGLTLDKTATPTTYDAVGDVISYSYLVTNTGNVTLTGVTVTRRQGDGHLPGGRLSPRRRRSPARRATRSTQADLDAGSVVTNVATADSNGTEPVHGHARR